MEVGSRVAMQGIVEPRAEVLEVLRRYWVILVVFRCLDKAMNRGVVAAIERFQSHRVIGFEGLCFFVLISA